MASIREKGEGHEIIFTDRSRDPSKIYLYYGPDYSKEELKKIKKRLEEDYRWGLKDPWEIPGKKYNPRVQTAIKNYIKYKENESEDWSSKHTSSSNKTTILRFGKAYSNIKIQELTKDHIDNFINREGLARATRESYLRDINTFLGWAGLDIENPPIRADKQEKQISFITESEVQEVNETIIDSVNKQIEKGLVSKSGPNSLWLVNLLSWSFYSGMRPSEILALTHDDYDHQQKVVHIRKKTKNNKPRTLPIGDIPILVKIMEEMTDPEVREKKAEDPTWKEDRIFGHYDVDNASEKVRKYIKKTFTDNPERANKLKWYSYRHGCAVWLLSNGVPIYSVSKWLGHSSVRTTERNYADIIQSGLGDQISQAHSE